MFRLLLPFTLVLLVACSPKSDVDHWHKALQAQQKGDLATAVIELKNAIRLVPDNGDYRFKLGQIYLEQKSYDAAEKELLKALEVTKNRGAVQTKLLEFFELRGDHKAIERIELDHNDFAPDEFANAGLIQAQSFIKRGKHARALSVINEIKRIPGAEFEKEMALALEDIIKNNLQSAITRIEMLLEQKPLDITALKLYAELGIRSGDITKATKGYESYLGEVPDDEQAKLTFVRLLSDLNRHSRYEPYVDDLLILYPSSTYLLQLKAVARANQNDFEAAYLVSQKVLKQEPHDIISRLIAGLTAYFLDDISNAHRHLALVAGQLPKNHVALRFLADSQLRLGLVLESFQTSNEFELQSSQDAVLFSKIGFKLREQGEIHKAQTLSKREPSGEATPKSLTLLGELKLSLDDVSGIAELEQAKTLTEKLEQDPYKIELALANAYLQTESYEAALELAKQWQQKQSNRLDGLLLEAKVFGLKKNLELAQKAYASALLLSPNNPSIELALIESKPASSPQDIRLRLQEIEVILIDHPDYVPAIVRHYLFSKHLGFEETMSAHLSNQIERAEQPESLWLTLAKLKLMELDYKGAIEIFERYTADEPKPHWRLLAFAYLKESQVVKAKQLFDRWHQKQPNHPEALIGFLNVLRTQAQHDKAIGLVKQFREQVRDDIVEVALIHCRLYLEVKQVENSRQCLQALDKNVVSLPQFKLLNGQVLLSENKPEQALSFLRAAYLDSPSASTSAFLATALIASKGANNGIAFLKQHVRQHPSDVTSRLKLAELQIDKQPQLAIEQYRQVLSQNKDNIIALNNLAYLLSSLGELEQAHQYAAQANVLFPNDMAILDTLGEIELRLGRNEAALKHLSRAYEITKSDHTEAFVVNYIEALLKNNQLKLAKRRIESHSFSEQRQLQRLAELKRLYL